MQEVQPAKFKVYWQFPDLTGGEDIEVQYNPTELSFDKAAQIAEINIPGLDSPLLQFIRGQNEKLMVDLFFDTTSSGMGSGAQSVAQETDKIYQLLKIRPDRHSPPVCDFIWGSSGFPGNYVSDKVGGNQRRGHFRCVVESVKQKFTLFSTEGIPLRATLTVSLREFRLLEEQLPSMNRNSPDRTNSHVLSRGETLSSVSYKHYLKPSSWRDIADANGIEDPRRLEPGMFLKLPRTEGRAVV